jgi:hypothetical protein
MDLSSLNTCLDFGCHCGSHSSNAFGLFQADFSFIKPTLS